MGEDEGLGTSGEAAGNLGGWTGIWSADVKSTGGGELEQWWRGLAQIMEDGEIERRMAAAGELVWATTQKVKG